LFLVFCKGLSCRGKNTDKEIAEQCSENRNATCEEGTDIDEKTARSILIYYFGKYYLGFESLTWDLKS
jgi:hypothetical protein